MKWTLPNILTLLRLAAAPSVPIIILYFQQPLSYLIALAIFVLAGMTDFIDGYLARLWKQETAFGKRTSSWVLLGNCLLSQSF